MDSKSVRLPAVTGLDGKPLGTMAMKVLELRFTQPDWTGERIAKELSISPSRVSQVLNHPRVLQAFRPLAKRRMTNTILPKAVKAIEEVIEQRDNPTAREKAASRVCASEKVFDSEPVIQVNNTINMLSTDELLRKVNTIREIMPPVVDAEVVDEA